MLNRNTYIKFLNVPFRLMKVKLSFVIMKLIPFISPKGFRIDKFSNVFGVLQVALVGFMSIVAVLVLLEARPRS